jgi:hypothetical protein
LTLLRNTEEFFERRGREGFAKSAEEDRRKTKEGKKLKNKI